MKASKQSVYIETTIVSYFVSRPSRDLTIAARQTLTRECTPYEMSGDEGDVEP